MSGSIAALAVLDTATRIRPLVALDGSNITSTVGVEVAVGTPSRGSTIAAV